MIVTLAITKSWKGPGFKPSGVQVKFLPALCYWAWRGVFANSLSVGSAVSCPKKFRNLKKKKILKRNPASLLFRFPAWKFERHMSEQAQKVASEAVFFLSNGAIWGNFLLNMEISQRILPFQKRVLPFDHIAKKRKTVEKQWFLWWQNFTIFVLKKKSQASNMVKGILGNFQKNHHISRKRDMKSPRF